MSSRWIASVIVSLLLVLAGTSCQRGEPQEYGPIHIGVGESLSSVELSKETVRSILLSGGNNKYTASVENAQIATVEVAQDTLRIHALLEGETYATITSHDFVARLSIKVAPHALSLSQDEIVLVPSRDEWTRQIRLSGGGDVVSLRVDDPDNALAYKWNGQTSILELRGKWEGEATVTVVSQSGEERMLSVRVRGGDKYPTEPGVYGTNAASYYKLLNPHLIVRRAERGVWICEDVRPGSRQFSTIFVPSFAPTVVGQELDLPVTFSKGYVSQVNFKGGTYHFRIVALGERSVTLRAPGFLLVVPYR